MLVDITLPDKDRLELIKDIQAIRPGLPILAMSMQDESLYAARVLRAGGRGYVMKAEGLERLVPAIRTVLSGQVALTPRMPAKVLESMVRPSGKVGGGPEAKLSDGELEVLHLSGEGWGTEEIATRLHLSPKTVDVHRAHMKEKLGFKTTPEFTRFAIRWPPRKAGRRSSSVAVGQFFVGTSRQSRCALLVAEGILLLPLTIRVRFCSGASGRLH